MRLNASTTSVRMPLTFGMGLSLPTKETVVDAAAEMLGEIAVDLRLDDRARLIWEDELLYHEILSFYFIIS